MRDYRVVVSIKDTYWTAELFFSAESGGQAKELAQSTMEALAAVAGIDKDRIVVNSAVRIV